MLMTVSATDSQAGYPFGGGTCCIADGNGVGEGAGDGMIVGVGPSVGAGVNVGAAGNGSASIVALLYHTR